MRVLIAALFMFLAATASYGQTGPGRPEPGLFAGATKAKLTTRVIPAADKADAASFCHLSKDEIDREARAVLDGGGVTLTEKGQDITVAVEVELYYLYLDEPEDLCAARVSVRGGISTEIHLPYVNVSTERWVDLLELSSSFVATKGYISSRISESVNTLLKSFVMIWREDQRK